MYDRSAGNRTSRLCKVGVIAVERDVDESNKDRRRDGDERICDG
jgi:hypothetical protein